MEIGDASTPPSRGIIEEIASREGVDPLELDVRMYDVIELDALDALIDHQGADVTVEFSVLDYTVRVTEEAIEISERASPVAAD